MKKNKIIISSIFCISLLFASNVTATTLSDYEKELEEIKKEQQEATDQLTGIDREISEIVYDLIVLDGEIGKYSIKLSELNAEMEEVNSKLDEQEQALQTSSLSYSAAQELYETRLRIIYENGIPNAIDLFFTSSGIEDFLSKLNVLNSILEYDKNLVNNLKSQKEYIDDVKGNIEIQKVQLEQLTYDAEKSAEALDDARDAKQNKMDSLNDSKETLEAYNAELKEQEKEAENKIQEEIDKLGSIGAFNGLWYYPTPGFTIITAKFKEQYDPWNSGSTREHGGADIAGSGIEGTPIYAMGDGTVVVAAYGWNYSYGNYVIIDHGTSALDGIAYKSLYAHQQSLAVTVGQKVTKGQIIGYVGNTGNSTGPHLHLELYKNNVRSDALMLFQHMNFTFR